MSLYIEPKTINFRDYFDGVVAEGLDYNRTIYLDINPAKKNERHKVSFYITSHSPGAAVGSCYAKA